MAIFGNNILAGASGQSTGVNVGTYTGKSLIFNSGSSHHLSKTWSSTETDLDKFTFSVWIKRGILDSGSTQYWLFGASSSKESNIRIQADKIEVHLTGSNYDFTSTRLLRDTASWYHLCFIYDSDQGSAGDRLKLYINGELETWASSSTIPSGQDNEFLDSGARMDIGSDSGGNNDFDGYMADLNVIDGTAVAATSFGETSDDTGEWVMKDYTGSHGNNGFRMKFTAADGGTVSDQSANSNTFTADNYSSDVDGYYVDSTPVNTFWCIQPTITINAGSTGSGGTTYYRGSTSNHGTAYSNPLPTTGKWYIECDVGSATNNATFGVADISDDLVATGTEIGGNARHYGYRSDGNFKNSGSSITTDVNSWGHAGDDIVSIAWDADNGKVWFALDGTWQGASSPNPATDTAAAYSSIPNKHSFCVAMSSGESSVSDKFNFGATPSQQLTVASGNADANGYGNFEYAPPSGFLALCTANLPEIEIGQEEDDLAHDFFNTVIYTGNGSSGHSITGMGFSPDLLWMMPRSSGDNGHQFDIARGTTKKLKLNAEDAEDTNDPPLITFESDGFDIDTTDANYNGNTNTYVAWGWKMGTAVSGTTTGSGTGKAYSGEVNADSGCGVLKFIGNGTSGHTIPHHLNSAPEFIVSRRTNSSNAWYVYHVGTDVSAPQDKYMSLDTTSAVSDQTAMWNDTAPSSSVITVGDSSGTNSNTDSYVLTYMHSVEGFSKFGRYEAAGGTQQFVSTGFPVGWLMVKRVDSSDNWTIHDIGRDSTGNPSDSYLLVDDTASEATFSTALVDFYSNGFCWKGAVNYGNNASGTYLFVAFSRGTGFKYSTAI